MASPLKRKLNQLNAAIQAATDAQRKSTGEYGYWGLQTELDKLQKEKLQLLYEAIDLLYEEFGYKAVSGRLNTLSRLAKAKALTKQIEQEL